LVKRFLAMSNHARMLGGGEYSFVDFISHLPFDWKAMVAVPREGELSSRLKKKKIETYTLPTPSIRPWHLAKILASLRAYIRFCQQHRPKLIYANGTRAALYGGIIGKLTGLPVIWHCRTLHRDKLLDPILTILISCIIANSHATSKRISARNQDKTRVVYNGIDIKWLQDDRVQKTDYVKDDWSVVLIVARISRWKRHDIVLSAFERAALSDPNMHLICLGDEDKLELEWCNYLKKKSNDSPFSDRIHWVGKAEDVRPWYRGGAVLVLGSDNEPFGRVIIEAMACGVPVIAARGGGVSEIIRHKQDGYLVDFENPDMMARAIVKVLKNSELREDMIKSALKRTNVFTLNEHVANMIDVFENVIRNRV